MQKYYTMRKTIKTFEKFQQKTQKNIEIIKKILEIYLYICYHI